MTDHTPAAPAPVTHDDVRRALTAWNDWPAGIAAGLSEWFVRTDTICRALRRVLDADRAAAARGEG